MSDHKQLSLNVLSLLRGDNFLTINRPLAHQIGLIETICLSDLVSKYEYHRDRGELVAIKDKDGYFYSCIDDMTKRTTLCRSAQDSAIKRLSLLGLVSHVVKGLPAKRYFKIHVDKILEMFSFKENSTNLLESANLFVGTSKLECQNQQTRMPKSANPIIRNTRSDIRDQKDTTTQHALECAQGPEKPAAPSASVVVSKKIPKIEQLKLSPDFLKRILDAHTIEDLTLAVERTLKWKGRKSDESGVVTALQRKDSWTDEVTQEDLRAKNLEYLYTLRHFDWTDVRGYSVRICNTYVEFIAGTKVVIMSIEDKDFIERLKAWGL